MSNGRDHPAAGYGALFDAVRGLRWPARRAVGAAPPGAHRSSQRGTAGEFTEYRLYRQGDDTRAIDWKLLGRSDRAFIKLSDDRALLTTWVVVDGSASMAFPDESLGTRRKFRMACEVAIGLAAVVHASSDPVGVIVTHAAGVSRVPPRTRRGTVPEIARVLESVSCGGGDTLTSSIASLSPNSRIVCLTDCLGDQEALLRTAAALTAAGAQFECVHVVAAEELTLPAGAHLVRDPESADARDGGVVLPARERTAYAQAFEAFRDSTRQRWRAIGAGYTEVHTSHEPARAVRAVVVGTGSC
jgi:uncharacterized protein (DUF58 family)